MIRKLKNETHGYLVLGQRKNLKGDVYSMENANTV